MANRRVLKYDRCCKRCGATPIYGSKYCDDCKGHQSEGWDKGKPRLCDECGAEYEARHPKSRYCSRSCQGKASKDRRSRLPHTHTCKGCGKGYTPRRSDAHTYCSRECAFEDWALHKKGKVCVVRFPECVECGSRFASNGPALVCGSVCRDTRSRRISREKAKEQHTSKTVQCRQCKTVFRTRYGDTRSVFCSKACARASREPGNFRRRARNHGVTHEHVNPLKVFERDGWRCQICGKDTPQSRRGSRMSNAPELDHRIPMSCGGPHSYENVQCTCHSCNQEKSNRSEVGQYPLLSIV